MTEEKYLSIDISIMYRCNQKYFDKLLDKYGIGYTHLIFLTQIYENEGISMVDLATSGVFDKGTITKSIQKLEQLGFVRVEVSDQDKRARLLHTTEKTQKIMPELYKQRSIWNSYLSSDITEEELDAYYKTLDKLIEKAREYANLTDQQQEPVRFYGLQKLTLLDFPNQMACTAFTGGCNFRCPFCHNRSLVFLNENDQEILEEDILDYLTKRNKVLDGICITGGEPLLHKGIKNFIKKVKELGLKVKLDTNGSQYEMLKELIDEGLVDYVAMDIKNCEKKYPMTIGMNTFDMTAVKKSIKLLLTEQVDYEFRTTVVNEYHSIDDIKKIGKLIKGAKAYYLQNFEDHGNCIVQGLSAVSEDTLYKMGEVSKSFAQHVEIRGVKG